MDGRVYVATGDSPIHGSGLDIVVAPDKIQIVIRDMFHFKLGSDA
jgi:hypothetical protein